MPMKFHLFSYGLHLLFHILCFPVMAISFRKLTWFNEFTPYEKHALYSEQ